MMKDFKIVYDAVHGSTKLDEPLLSLFETPEMQRMNGIRQLGLSYLIFPGANHTRLEHSLGTSYLAEQFANMLNLSHDEKLMLRASGLLHDLGHTPYSHTLEELMFRKTKKSHMDITKEIIEGKLDIIKDRGIERISTILEHNGISIKDVVKAIMGIKSVSESLDPFLTEEGQSYFNIPNSYLYNIINGDTDVDQLDYLVRDAHYTGVAHGIIDIPRILHTIRIFHGELVMDKKGVSAIEGVLVARALMYTSVYFHKTARIAELMLSRAVEELNLNNWFDLYTMSDSELISMLINSSGYAKEIGLRLKYRRLYKRAYFQNYEELSEQELEKIIEYSDPEKRRKLELEFEDETGLERGEVIIDVPEKEAKLTEPRFSGTNIKIYDQNNVTSLKSISPLVKSLSYRRPQDWAIMIIGPEEKLEKLKKVAKRYF